MNRIDICKNIIQSIKDYITTPEKLEPHRVKNHFVAFVKCYCIYFLKNFQFFNFIQFSFKIMQIFYCARSQSVLNYIVVTTSTKPLNFSSFKGSF